MYSQNSEEQIILDFFKNYPTGTFLDLGSFTGIELSNVRALAEKGFSGVMVEASPTIFEKLVSNYKDFENIDCYNVAVGTETKKMQFYDNHNAVGTLKEDETKRWGDKEKFNLIEVPCVEINEFLGWLRYKTFNFISSDTEGSDVDILKQLDLDKLGCKMYCIEWNSVHSVMLEIMGEMLKYGMNLIHVNAENLIFSI